MIVANPARGGRLAMVLALTVVLHLATAARVHAADKPAPAAAPATAPAAAPVLATTPDYSGYQKLLEEFVVTTSAPGAPTETGFNYEAVFLQLDRNDRLNAIHKQLALVAPSRMKPEVRKAWAINTYNFLVIENIVYHLYVGPGGVTKQAKTYLVKRRTSSVQEIRMPGKFFETPVIELEGVKYTLDQFERHFLFKDFERAPNQPAPAGIDPRLHFAVVCGSRSCPPLQPKAFTPDGLDQELDAAVRNALASPRLLRWDPASGLVGSMLFVWYGADFGVGDGIVGFVKRYAPAEIVKSMEAANTTSFANFTPWDWKYNEPADKSAGATKPGTPGKKDG